MIDPIIYRPDAASPRRKDTRWWDSDWGRTARQSGWQPPTWWLSQDQ